MAENLQQFIDTLRAQLAEEIKVVLAATPKGGGDPYYRGRLSGLLFVRDRILYDANSAALSDHAQPTGRQAR